MPMTNKEENRTWQHRQDVKRLIRAIRGELAHVSGCGDPDKDGQQMITELEEHLEWLVQAAEERDRLKRPPLCEGCGGVIPCGTGLEKDGKLTPLCPRCQGKRVFAEGA